MTNVPELILKLAFSGILPYIAPVIFILSAIVVCNYFISLIRGSIDLGIGKSRRSQ